MTATHTFVARFTITGWDETELPVEGGWAAGVKMQKEYTEGIVGSSTGLLISSGNEEGKRAYLAVEQITGSLPNGRTGSFTVHHGGLESDPGSLFGYIVNGTGTGDLTDIAGSLIIGHDENGAYFTVALEP